MYEYRANFFGQWSCASTVERSSTVLAHDHCPKKFALYWGIGKLRGQVRSASPRRGGKLRSTVLAHDHCPKKFALYSYIFKKFYGTWPLPKKFALYSYIFKKFFGTWPLPKNITIFIHFPGSQTTWPQYMTTAQKNFAHIHTYLRNLTAHDHCQKYNNIHTFPRIPEHMTTVT